MGVYSQVLEQVVLQIAGHVRGWSGEAHIEPIGDGLLGDIEGFVVESAFERILVVTTGHECLSLADVGLLRRVMAKAQTRRAVLYLPPHAVIQSPVHLLASLSRIELLHYDHSPDGSNGITWA
jgi:hypothetical protein